MTQTRPRRAAARRLRATRMPVFVGIVLIWAAAGLASQDRPNAEPQAVFDDAVDDFINGNIQASAESFDLLVELMPNFAPRLWQRGIVLYYAARYDDCIAQFESHRTVNPNDVENAAWHFLCVARSESPESARSRLLPVGPDTRVPMQQIYELYAGTLTPGEVMQAAGNSPSGEFYGHLYLGLYAEAQGEHEAALEHIRAAAGADYARVGGYMHTVAVVHLRMLEAQP